MDVLNQTLLIAGLLCFVAIALSAASQKIGVPSLLVFLAVGLFATELPQVRWVHIELETAVLVGNLALAVILLDGGLRTRLATFRMVAAPSLTLATFGVILTAALVGVAGAWLLDLDWRYGLLLGSIVGSTDAAATFALLGNSGLRLNERVESTLEVESGINDPMAVFLTLGTIELIRSPARSIADLLPMFLQQLGIGVLVGVALGYLLSLAVARVRLDEGLYALLIQSGGLATFALTNLLGGSGFLAIYLAGMLIAHRRAHVGEDVLRVSDGFAWLAQAGMFLVLGLITDVRGLLDVAGPALLVAAVLLFIARPLAVAACLLPFRYPAREIAFIGWIGMRGAVPIVLGLFPLVAGIPQAQLLFHIAFFIVLLSLLLQGGSLPVAARLARVRAGRPRAALATAPLDGGVQVREVVQFVVAEGAPATRRALDELDWPEGARLVELERAGRIVEPTELRSGDLVAVVAPAEQVGALEEIFAPAAVDGELTLAASATLGDLQDYYGVEIPEGLQRDTTLAAYVSRLLRGRAASGDAVARGSLRLRVRESSAGVVRSFSLLLKRR
ncbi:MAG TPA: potassium/proton antiporter [Burkholderiaceae bacterium]|nr:potassium/proton antiporter [Burkholderiaceae bacterium]